MFKNIRTAEQISADEQKAAKEKTRAERDTLLRSAFAIRDQYQNELKELDLGIIESVEQFKYSEAQYVETLQYIRALKDAPESGELPEKPEWM